MERVKTAIIGCGSISNIYMESFTNGKFSIIELVACSDLDETRMRQSAERFSIRAMTLEEILADASIELVINLTTPTAHYPINKRALLAGKHVFSEKMIAVELEESRELVALANEKGLHLGVAPDTFLGAGIQTGDLVTGGIAGRQHQNRHQPVEAHPVRRQHPDREIHRGARLDWFARLLPRVGEP